MADQAGADSPGSGARNSKPISSPLTIVLEWLRIHFARADVLIFGRRQSLGRRQLEKFQNPKEQDMSPTKWIGAAALLSAALISTPVLSQTSSSFAALQGMSAQALSEQEMDAVSGELNASTILAALQSVSTKLSSLAQQNTKLVPLSNAAQNVVSNFNATAVNQLLMKLHIYTPK